MTSNKQWPLCITNCCDCGAGTFTIDEWYMVNDDVWEQAWSGCRKPHHELLGQEILCIGCLEKRIGRTLCRTDFIDVPVNDPNEYQHSDRLRDRFVRKPPTATGA